MFERPSRLNAQTLFRFYKVFFCKIGRIAKELAWDFPMAKLPVNVKKLIWLKLFAELPNNRLTWKVKTDPALELGKFCVTLIVAICPGATIVTVETAMNELRPSSSVPVTTTWTNRFVEVGLKTKAVQVWVKVLTWWVKLMHCFTKLGCATITMMVRLTDVIADPFAAVTVMV
jgi:hypothetical protein